MSICLIARHTRKILYEQTGIKFNRLGFLTGNILPDLDKKLVCIPHFLKESLSFVSTMFFQLGSDLSYQERDCRTFRFGIDAGIICHYLSDYFCFAHNESYKEDLHHHYLYEFLMLFQFHKAVKNLGNIELEPVQLSLISQKVQILAGQYNQKPRHYFQDISYALRVSSIASYNLILKASVTGHSSGRRP